MTAASKSRAKLTYISAFILLFLMTSCTGFMGTDEGIENSKLNRDPHVKNEEITALANAELAKLSRNLTTHGPNGEEPVLASSIQLTSKDKEEVRELNLKAAISMHYMGSDWSITQVRALIKRFSELGIEVIEVTDANFKPQKQISDIEAILKKEPDILVSIPVDVVATAPIYQKAVDQGVKIVFMNQAAVGLRPGVDYVTIVSPDDYGNAARGAHMIARELGGKGKVGVIYHGADFSTTSIRFMAFQDAIRLYPDISIEEAQGISGPDFKGEAEQAASGMLLRHPDLDAIWGIWDDPTEGILAAARKSDRHDLIVTTVDLGTEVAIEMAKDGMIKGVGAQTVYEMGVTEATAAALAMLGKEVPIFIVMEGIATDRKNLLDVWKRVYNQDPPRELLDAYNN